MTTAQQLKRSLFALCQENIDQRIESLENNLVSIRESKNSEGKSSAGDKYETGRAMMQLEEERNRGLMAEAIAVKKELMSFDIEKPVQSVQSGSLVKTSNGTYFISIGLGKVTFEGAVYFCVSVGSPIGKELKGMNVGGQLLFNGKKITIQQID